MSSRTVRTDDGGQVGPSEGVRVGVLVCRGVGGAAVPDGEGAGVGVAFVDPDEGRGEVLGETAVAVAVVPLGVTADGAAPGLTEQPMARSPIPRTTPMRDMTRSSCFH